MTLRLDFAVLADYALVDQQGKLSVLGIFQHVWVAEFPTIHPRTHLVLRVRGRRTDIGTHGIRIRFVDEDDTELLGGEGSVQFGEPAAGITEVEAGAVLVFDVPLPRAGAFAFEIALDGGGRHAGASHRQPGQGHRRSLRYLPTDTLGYESRL